MTSKPRNRISKNVLAVDKLKNSSDTAINSQLVNEVK